MSIFDSIVKKDHPHQLQAFPLVHVKDVVVFPNTIVPFMAVSKSTIAAVEEAAKTESLIFIALLRSENLETKQVDVHQTGTLCRVIQKVAMPDGSLRLLLSGERSGHIEKIRYDGNYISCDVVFPPEVATEALAVGAQTAALIRASKRSFIQYADLVKKIPPETLATIDSIDQTAILANIIANTMNVKVEKKQAILDIADPDRRLEQVITLLESEIEVIGLQKKISQKVKNKIEKNQREYFLQEQMREINKELGRDGEENELDELTKRIQARLPPQEVLEKSKRELSRLGKLQPMSPEAGILRTYCEWIADLPWSDKTEENRDIELARGILDQDHFGLKKVKERILQFIAVRQLKEQVKGPILCFVGAPGTGKTSLAQSVARALGRNFIRISLGGIRDEAEIRGHRKTYVGALPGKIIQGIKKAGSANPVFLLDEIDKMSSDFRGDPASAMLEVLDPEQNRNFADHYLELPYDLSRVMFITTANSLQSIPYPLLDRLEIIEIPGYSEFEKLEIARSFIIPKQMEENGLKGAGIEFSKDAILDVVRHYTMESGVRSLEREVASIARRIACEAVKEGYGAHPATISDFSYSVSADNIPELLGKRKREEDETIRNLKAGTAIGLAWTEMGGTILPMETARIEGNGEFILTGNLGDVMKESARTALSFIRSNLDAFPQAAGFDYKKTSIHIHVPQGAIPKDGPSAGVTITAALLSLLCGKPLRESFAMTGEITLSGKILPVGGIKEKVLAAHRYRIQNILLPEANRKDLDEIPEEVMRAMKFHFASEIMSALSILFDSGLIIKPEKTSPSAGLPLKAKTASKPKRTIAGAAKSPRKEKNKKKT
jgi:ATP-dependent Lon protease